MDTNTKDELHTVEVEGQDIEGQNVKAVLVSLKPSTLPSVSQHRVCPAAPLHYAPLYILRDCILMGLLVAGVSRWFHHHPPGRFPSEGWFRSHPYQRAAPCQWVSATELLRTRLWEQGSHYVSLLRLPKAKGALLDESQSAFDTSVLIKNPQILATSLRVHITDWPHLWDASQIALD